MKAFAESLLCALLVTVPVSAKTDVVEPGEPLSDPFNVASLMESGGAPVVGSAASGDLVYIWDGRDSILAQRRDRFGNSVGEVIGVSTTSADLLFLSNMAVNAAGESVAVWKAYVTGGAHEFDVYAQRLDENGKHVGGEILVPSANGRHSDITQPVVSMGSDGSFVVGWSDWAGMNLAGYAQRYDANGDPLGAIIEVAPDMHETFLDLRVTHDGGFLVAWEDRSSPYGVAVRKYDASGNSVFGPVHTNWIVGKQFMPALAFAADGSFAVASEVTHNSVSNIYIRFYSPAVGATTAETLVTSSDNYFSFPVVSAVPTGGYVVAWIGRVDDDFALFARRFTSNGAAAGDEFMVSVAEESINRHRLPSIAVAVNGNMAFAWQNEDYMRGRVMAGAGRDLAVEVSAATSVHRNVPAELDIVLKNNTVLDSQERETDKYVDRVTNGSVRIDLPSGVSLDSLSETSTWKCRSIEDGRTECAYQATLHDRGDSSEPLALSLKFSETGSRTVRVVAVSEDTGDSYPADNVSEATVSVKDAPQSGSSSGGGTLFYLLAGLLILHWKTRTARTRKTFTWLHAP